MYGNVNNMDGLSKTPQEFLLHKGALSREQQRRSFVVKPPSVTKNAIGNRRSNSNLTKIHYNSQPAEEISDWHRASSTTGSSTFKRSDSFSQSISSTSTTISSIGLPPEDLLRDMAMSAVQTVTNGVNKSDQSLQSNSDSRYSANGENSRLRQSANVRSSGLLTGSDAQSLSRRKMMSSSSVNDRKSNTTSTKDLVNMAEDIAERFREGVSTYGNRRSFSGTRFDALMRTSVYEGMEINIPTYTTADRGGSKHSLYTINIRLSTGHQWVVERRYKQMNTLHHVVRNQVGSELASVLPSFPAKRYLASSLSSSFVEERRVKLEAYLKALVKLPQVWKIEELAHFLDDASKSMTLRLHYTYLLHDNENFDKLCSTSGNVLRDCIQKIRSQEQLIEKLKMRCMNQEEKLKEVQGTLQSYKIQSKLGIDLHQKSSFNGSTPMAIPSAGSDSKGESGKHIFDNSNSNNRDFIKMSPFISTPGIESNLMNIVSSPMPSNHSNQIPSSRKYYDGYQEHSNNRSFRAMEVSQGAATGLIDDPWSSSSSFTTMMHNYTNNGTKLPLPLEQISFHIEKHSADDYIDNILKLISPTVHDRENQKAVSDKLFSMFTEDLAVAHICNIESTALGTFLPNEPISISVFLFSDEDEAKLLDVQRTLCDYILLNTSTDLNKSDNGGSVPKTGQPNSNSLRSLNIMKVSHVSTTRTADNNLELKCNIDGSDVIIKKNSLSSLYLSAMIEEADQIIGKHHLVKQGLILVRSWCKKECQSYWGGSNLTLSDESIFVVILYIFNMYHARLHFPLQVLATFLYVMSSFKWDEHALTINGPIETRGRAVGHPADFDNADSNNGMNNENETIFSEKFVHRYRSNYEECIKFTEARGEGNRKSGSVSSTSSSEEERYVSGENKNIGSATRSQFCATPISIISPLDLSNNVTEYIKKDNALKLYSAFCQGARGFNQLMKCISQDYDDLYHRTWPSSRSSASNFVSNSSRTIQDRVESCFTNILKVHQHRKMHKCKKGHPYGNHKTSLLGATFLLVMRARMGIQYCCCIQTGFRDLN